MSAALAAKEHYSKLEWANLLELQKDYNDRNIPNSQSNAFQFPPTGNQAAGSMESSQSGSCVEAFESRCGLLKQLHSKPCNRCDGEPCRILSLKQKVSQETGDWKREGRVKDTFDIQHTDRDIDYKNKQTPAQELFYWSYMFFIWQSQCCFWLGSFLWRTSFHPASNASNGFG